MFYMDKNIINNTSLACFLLVLFAEEYAKVSSDNRYPDLMKCLAVLPLVWHKLSRDAIKTKKNTTPLGVAITETPLIKSNFKRRITDYTGATVQGLNFAVSTGLLVRIVENDMIFFKRSSSRWPNNVKKSLPPDMARAITRIANWFNHMDSLSVYSLLLGKSL